MADAFAAMPADLSARRKAGLLAARVVSELLELVERQDTMADALVQARLALTGDPALRLATDPDLALFNQLADERCRRFRARGCVQLQPCEWAAETREIASILEDRLAERFRRQ